MRRGRPRQPKPLLRGRVYWTRVTFDVDDVQVRKWVNLQTGDLAVAKIKIGQIVKAGTAPEDAAEIVEVGETFEEAARRIVGASTIKTRGAQLARLENHVLPHFGSKPVKDVRAGDLRAALEALAKTGASRQSCHHVRNDISVVLGELWRNDMLPENVAAKVRIPKQAKTDPRERAVLTDEELVRYLAWSHPDEKKQAAVLERQTMACVSRCFGGLRWGDIRALRWEAFETAGGAFTRGWAPRKKTARPQLLSVPAILRPIIRDWWERRGRPAAGLVFPTRRGETAGSERKPGSIARNLRRDLARAFGVDVPTARQLVRSNGRRDDRLAWVPGRLPTERERELLEETTYTRPVDFHSFRRAFKQGLADANVDVQQTMALSGATDMAAHARYLANTGKIRDVPLAALPDFGASLAETLLSGYCAGLVTDEFPGVSWCRSPDLNRGQRAYEARALTD